MCQEVALCYFDAHATSTVRNRSLCITVGFSQIAHRSKKSTKAGGDSSRRESGQPDLHWIQEACR